jgi:phenylacetate-coenzyme A ligase PaaK-like adenylate-forming protein
MLLNHIWKLRSFYDRSPVWLQNVGLSGVGLLNSISRYNGDYERRYAAALDRQDWAAEQTRQYVDAKVRWFVRHAAETVPYYRDQFQQLGLDPRDFSGAADLAELPVLSKAVVQDQATRFISEAVPASRQIRTSTSGTTGSGLEFVTTMPAIREQWATWWRYRSWHGISRPTEVAIFRAVPLVNVAQTAPPFWRCNRPGRELYLSASHLAPKHIPAFVDILNRRRPPWITGYPSVISIFAAFMLDAGLTLDYALDWVTTGSENLTRHQADLIERAFGVRPVQNYGLNEAVCNISQHLDGGLYIDEDFAAVEIIDGRIVGTNFCNPAFPLIRYDSNDRAEFDGSVNSVGWRRVTSLDGRAEDYVVRKDGAKIGRLDWVFRRSYNIREAQIRQSMIGEVEILVARRDDYGEDDEQVLLSSARDYLGYNTKINIRYVAAIDRPKSGKLRLVVSSLAQLPN